MNIIHSATSYPPHVTSGTATITQDLCHWFSQGSQNHVTLFHPVNNGHACHDTVAIHHLHPTSIPAHFRPDIRFITPSPQLITRTIHSHPPDIIHIHDLPRFLTFSSSILPTDTIYHS